jgi:hypothetical protein
VSHVPFTAFIYVLFRLCVVHVLVSYVALVPNQVLNAKKGELLRQTKKGAWMPYARQRQVDSENNLQGKLIKASRVAQVTHIDTHIHTHTHTHTHTQTNTNTYSYTNTYT